MADKTVIVGVFTERVQADQAMDDLQQAGFRDVGFLVRDDNGTTQALPEVSDDTNQDNEYKTTATGIVTGGVVGGVVGAAAALLIPGIGPAIAGGIVTTMLGGAALGAATGGIFGSLMDLGVPEDAARHYDNEVRSGRTIVIVQAEEHPLDAFHILERHQPAYSSNHLQNRNRQDPAATVEMETLDR